MEDNYLQFEYRIRQLETDLYTIIDACARGEEISKIALIKFFRTVAKTSLIDSKNYIEDHMRMRPPIISDTIDLKSRVETLEKHLGL